MKVKFSAVEKFVEELQLEREDVADEIVRITYSYQPFKDHPHLMSLTVVAGIVVRGRLVELHKACGMV